MIEELNLPRPPNPILVHHTPAGPTIAKWVEHRRRTYHVSEAFQDVARHPWVGERQAGTAANLYTMTARGVDRELQALPYAQRLVQPRNGLWPIVTGAELGEGPNPWDRHSNRRYDQQRKRYAIGQGRRDFVKSRKTHVQPPNGPAAAAKPAEPLASKRKRSFGDRAKDVGKHALNAVAEVGVTALGSAYGAAQGAAAGPVGAAAGGMAGAALANRTYRAIAPSTGQRRISY